MLCIHPHHSTTPTTLARIPLPSLSHPVTSPPLGVDVPGATPHPPPRCIAPQSPPPIPRILPVPAASASRALVATKVSQSPYSPVEAVPCAARGASSASPPPSTRKTKVSERGSLRARSSVEVAASHRRAAVSDLNQPLGLQI